MRAFPWVIAGVGVGLAVYYLASLPEYRYAGSGDLEEAADRSTVWGAKQRFKGSGGSILGRVKEGFGRATGDDELAGEGVVDQAVGGVKDTAGRAAGAVGDALRDLNR